MPRCIGLALALALMLALIVSVPSARAQQQEKPGTTHLKAGDPAPDFTLRDQNTKPVKLSDFKGKKNVVLAFYVLAFTGG